MGRRFQVGDCVRLSDRRVGRIRGKVGGRYRVRVRRKTSKTHQFLLLPSSKIALVACPKGWMSPEGYRRYLKPTLAKLRRRLERRRSRRRH